MLVPHSGSVECGTSGPSDLFQPYICNANVHATHATSATVLYCALWSVPPTGSWRSRLVSMRHPTKTSLGPADQAPCTACTKSSNVQAPSSISHGSAHGSRTFVWAPWRAGRGRTNWNSQEFSQGTARAPLQPVNVHTLLVGSFTAHHAPRPLKSLECRLHGKGLRTARAAIKNG